MSAEQEQFPITIAAHNTSKRLDIQKGPLNLKFEFVIGPDTPDKLTAFLELIDSGILRKEVERLVQETVYELSKLVQPSNNGKDISA